MNNCDPIKQQARQDLLEEAYALDGRDDPSHEHHLTYTGLAATEAYKSLVNPQPTPTPSN